MAKRALLLIVAGGCNQVLGLDETVPTVPFFDAPPLIVPPDGNTMCPPAPDFEAWTYAPHSLQFQGAIDHATFLAPDRVVFASNGALYDSPLDGPPARITELEFMDGAVLSSPAAIPQRLLFWFMRMQVSSSGLYYADRAAGSWMQTRADFAITAYQLQAGIAAYYGGAIRMVIAETKVVGDYPHLVEVESHEGTAWTRLDTVAWSTGTVRDFDAALSADGCMLFFRRSTPATTLQVAHRNVSGAFDPPSELVAATASATIAGYPTLDPTGTRLWFMRDNQLYEGRP